MKIYFAGDHAGFEMKKEMMGFVKELGHTVEDLGPFEPKSGDDYPDFVIPLARKVAAQEAQINADTKAQINADREHRRISVSYQRESAVRGIVVAGSGQGEIIAMNRIRGARAALFCPCAGTQINTDIKDADKRGCNVSHELIKASRDHNDSNIFAIGARFCTPEEAKQGIKVWLETPFSGEARHVRRLGKIDETVLST